jgi:hypothetical protein
MEVDADAAAICGEDQCIQVGMARAAEKAGRDSITE